MIGALVVDFLFPKQKTEGFFLKKKRNQHFFNFFFQFFGLKIIIKTFKHILNNNKVNFNLNINKQNKSWKRNIIRMAYAGLLKRRANDDLRSITVGAGVCDNPAPVANCTCIE